MDLFRYYVLQHNSEDQTDAIKEGTLGTLERDRGGGVCVCDSVCACVCVCVCVCV